MPLKEQQNHCDKGKTKGGFHKLVENTWEQVLEKENGCHRHLEEPARVQERK